MTISELYDLYKTLDSQADVPFFGYFGEGSQPDFLSVEYYPKSNIIDPIIVQKYADFEILQHQKKPLSEYANQDIISFLHSFRKSFVGWVTYYKYKWEELYKTTQYQYDPISNYDLTEDSNSLREQTDYNEFNTTNDYGSQRIDNTNKYGKNTGTSKQYSVPFDLSVGETQIKQTGSAVNENDSYTDNLSSVKGGHVDSSTQSQRIDGEVATTNHLTRKGNIGVQTTQEMIGKQRSIVSINILDQLFSEFFEFACLQYYSPHESYM